MDDPSYAALAGLLRPSRSREEAMEQVVDALWSALSSREVSWIGFYVDHPDRPADRRLVLGPHRDRPACSPIGLHGVCGAALLTRSVQIVTDIRDLGEAYIACDPRDRSELVLPLLEQAGECWGVFDLDSWAVNRFDAADERGVRQVLSAAGL